jgi:hypothetical protein
VPDDLSKEQKEAVEAMSKAFNGDDPRSGLFTAGSASKEAGDGTS